MEEKRGLPELPNGYEWDELSVSKISGGFASEFPHINLCLDRVAVEISAVWYVIRRATRHGETTGYFYRKAVWKEDIAPHLIKEEKKTHHRDIRTGGEDIDDLNI